MVNLPARPRDRAACMEGLQNAPQGGRGETLALARRCSIIDKTQRGPWGVGGRPPRSPLSFVNYALIFDHVNSIPHACLELTRRLCMYGSASLKSIRHSVMRSAMPIFRQNICSCDASTGPKPMTSFFRIQPILH